MRTLVAGVTIAGVALLECTRPRQPPYTIPATNATTANVFTAGDTEP